MPSKTVEAVILQVKPYGEADLIVDFFSFSRGRIKGIAKGAQKSRKRFIHCFQPLNLVRLTFFEKQNYSLARIDQGELIEPFSGIRKDFRKWGEAAYLCEMIQAFFAVGDPQPEVFELIQEALGLIAQDRPEKEIFPIVRIRLLKAAGYGFYLEGCLGCGKKVEDIPNPVFSFSGGGVFCPLCQKGEKGKGLSRGAIESLRKTQAMAVPQVFRIRFSMELQAEIEQLLNPFTARVLGKELVSTRYLKQIQEPYQ